MCMGVRAIVIEFIFCHNFTTFFLLARFEYDKLMILILLNAEAVKYGCGIPRKVTLTHLYYTFESSTESERMISC